MVNNFQFYKSHNLLFSVSIAIATLYWVVAIPACVYIYIKCVKAIPSNVLTEDDTTRIVLKAKPKKKNKKKKSTQEDEQEQGGGDGE